MSAEQSMNLADIAAASIVDGRSRGLPVAEPVRLSDVGARGWQVLGEDMCFPLLTLSLPAMMHNIRTMNDYARERGIYLCPHGKTMMAPQLFRAVLAGHRTIGLSAATVAQATVMAESGAATVLVANEIVGRANLVRYAGLLKAFPGTRFLSLVDSEATIDMLAACGDLLPANAIFQVLIELGFPSGRAGVRGAANVAALAHILRQRIAAGARIGVCGVETYEGALGEPSGSRLEQMKAGLVSLRDAYRLLADSGLFSGTAPPILSAGGSATFDIAADALTVPVGSPEPQVWLRGGVMATFDDVIYHDRLVLMDERKGFVLRGNVVSAVEAFHPALTLWAVVQSVPEPDLAILAAGIRDFPADAGFPLVRAVYRGGRRRPASAKIQPLMTKANDHHAFLQLPEGCDVKVGDLVELGISHPCTTFDKWPVLFCVDGDAVVGAIRTYF